MTGKQELLMQINEVSFAMDELRLFLDTHPECEEALADFTDKMMRRAELCDKYTENYGPLDSYFINTDNGYTWNEGPMPWQREAN